jgi:hypothetical protein
MGASKCPPDQLAASTKHVANDLDLPPIAVFDCCACVEFPGGEVGDGSSQTAPSSLSFADDG